MLTKTEDLQSLLRLLSLLILAKENLEPICMGMIKYDSQQINEKYDIAVEKSLMSNKKNWKLQKKVEEQLNRDRRKELKETKAVHLNLLNVLRLFDQKTRAKKLGNVLESADVIREYVSKNIIVTDA